MSTFTKREEELARLWSRTKKPLRYDLGKDVAISGGSFCALPSEDTGGSKVLVCCSAVAVAVFVDFEVEEEGLKLPVLDGTDVELRLLWSSKNRVFLLRRASGSVNGHLHHLCVLKWRAEEGRMALDDEAGIPFHLGWEHIRLLTDPSGPLPDVEEGAAGRPIPPLLRLTEDPAATANDVATAFDNLIDLVSAASSALTSEDLFELFDSRFAAGEEHFAVVLKTGDDMETLLLVEISSGDVLWKTKFFFAGDGSGAVGRVRVGRGYVLLQAAVYSDPEYDPGGEEDWHILVLSLTDGSELWRWKPWRSLLSLRTHENLILLETDTGSATEAKSDLVLFDVGQNKESRYELGYGQWQIDVRLPMIASRILVFSGTDHTTSTHNDLSPKIYILDLHGVIPSHSSKNHLDADSVRRHWNPITLKSVSSDEVDSVEIRYLDQDGMVVKVGCGKKADKCVYVSFEKSNGKKKSGNGQASGGGGGGEKHARTCCVL